MEEFDPQGWPYPGARRGPVITIPCWPFPFPLPVPSRRRRPSSAWPWPFTDNRTKSLNGTSSFVLHAAPQGGQSRDEYERATYYLRELAERTGARHHHATSLRNLEASFALIAEELRRQYSLGYYPKSPAQAGERRRIRVKVNQPNLVVRARDSYIFNPSANTVAAQAGGQPRSKFDEQIRPSVGR